MCGINSKIVTKCKLREATATSLCMLFHSLPFTTPHPKPSSSCMPAYEHPGSIPGQTPKLFGIKWTWNPSPKFATSNQERSLETCRYRPKKKTPNLIDILPSSSIQTAVLSVCPRALKIGLFHHVMPVMPVGIVPIIPIPAGIIIPPGAERLCSIIGAARVLGFLL